MEADAGPKKLEAARSKIEVVCRHKKSTHTLTQSDHPIIIQQQKVQPQHCTWNGDCGKY